MASAAAAAVPRARIAAGKQLADEDDASAHEGEVFLDPRLMRFAGAFAELADFISDESLATAQDEMRLVKNPAHREIILNLNNVVALDDDGSVHAENTYYRARRVWFGDQVSKKATGGRFVIENRYSTEALIELLPTLVQCFDFYAFDLRLTAPVLYAYSIALNEVGRSFQKALFLKAAPDRELPRALRSDITDGLGLSELAWTTLGPDASAVLRFAFSDLGDDARDKREHWGADNLGRRLRTRVSTKLSDFKEFWDSRFDPPRRYHEHNNPVNGASEQLNDAARVINMAHQLARELESDLAAGTRELSLAVGRAGQFVYQRVQDTMDSKVDTGDKIRMVAAMREKYEPGIAVQLTTFDPCYPNKGRYDIKEANDDYSKRRSDGSTNPTTSRTVEMWRCMSGVVADGFVLPVDRVKTEKDDTQARVDTSAHKLTVALPGLLRCKPQNVAPQYDYSECLSGDNGKVRKACRLVRTSPSIIDLASKIRRAICPFMVLLRIARAQDDGNKRLSFVDGGEAFNITEDDCKPIASVADCTEESIPVPMPMRRFLMVRDRFFSVVIAAMRTVLLGFYTFEFTALRAARKVDWEWAMPDDDDDDGLPDTEAIAKMDREEAEVFLQLKHERMRQLKREAIRKVEVTDHIATAMRLNGQRKHETAEMAYNKLAERLESNAQPWTLEELDELVGLNQLRVPLYSALDFVVYRYDADRDMEKYFKREFPESEHAAPDFKSPLDRHKPTSGYVQKNLERNNKRARTRFDTD